MVKLSTVLKILIGLEIFLLLYKYTPPEVKNSISSSVLPGYESNRLDELHPRLESKMKSIIAQLTKRGFTPKVYSTYRSPEMQDFYYSVSKGGRVFGASPMTRSKGGESCHNKQDKSGKPAATAVDIWGKPYGAFLSLRLDIHFNEHLRFFNALGKIVADEGLEWGGRWTSQHSIWADHGLGWDPAHIQMGRCR